MKSTCVFGIDPGKEGCLAILNDDPFTTDYILLKDLSFPTFRDLVENHKPHHIFLEKAQSMAKEGVWQKPASMFTYGTGYGRLIGWLEAVQIAFTLVPPAVWTREMHQGCTGADPKAKSAQAARQLFPKEDMRHTSKTKVHDGIVDAYLIAEFGRRVLTGLRLSLVKAI